MCGPDHNKDPNFLITILISIAKDLILLGSFPTVRFNTKQTKIGRNPNQIIQTKTCRLGPTIYVDGDNSSWVSPSGYFAFGFKPVADKNLFLLAIWFDKVPEKTIVWSAHKGNLVLYGSKVELKSSGQLVLSNNQGQEIWTAQVTNGSATSADILDTGNLVLWNSNSGITWQSFDHSTDTILPSQILDMGTTLSSRETETNYSSGKFELRFQTDGNLVLYTTNLLTNYLYNAYWSSSTAGTNSQMIFNQSGYIYLRQTNGSVHNLTLGNIVSTRDFYHRATLDFDGVFRQYIYPKNGSSNRNWAGESWSIEWSVPSDICWAITDSFGSGACGFNSYCRLDDTLRPSCFCPPNYSYFDSSNPFKGCKPDFVPQSCEPAGSWEEPRPQFRMTELPNTNWPMSDSERYNPINEDQCRELCLDDCFCAVAIFTGVDCFKKKLPLSNGRIERTTKALIKVPQGNSTSQFPLPSGSNRGKSDRGTLIIIFSTLLGSSVFLNLVFLVTILLAVFFQYQKKLLKHQPEQAPPEQNFLGMHLRSFTYKELEEATDGFKQELGSGAFGTVYKGVLTSSTGNFIAVKKLEKFVEEGDKEFKAEITAIGRIHHKNLVQLLGFCYEGSQRLLVYEFMSNGSLASFLFGSSRPSWNQRTQIAFGVARGLTYLHDECGNQIIHCDIKPQNILLDCNFTARISDFGLAKLMQADQTRTNTGLRGTKGYVAPEWFRNMSITTKVDVYSFGVLLLEIICCRKNVEVGLDDIENAILTYWAYDCYRERKLNLLVDDDEEAQSNARRLERFVMIAIWCIQEEPSLRPSMKKVTQMLEGAVEVSVPPDPSSFISSIG
ncbi:G-type lectin S-receptor-like serine/threonine-protein kinase LECRK2 [Tasmannia lanceolata]|uniref:G-type lectin S-receptor-like serine/threonine-protein kinase LECRK2 n=1 Tax=Tasmannia lanceolata TaxID=3420 RepID=UPI004063312E